MPSHTMAASNNTIIGIATRNNESGSGGLNAAESTNVVNQICRRYASSIPLLIAPERSARVVTKGA